MKKEKCNCSRLIITWDPDEHNYRPYCMEYDVWLEWDNRYKLYIPESAVYRSMICFEHGKPKQSNNQ